MALRQYIGARYVPKFYENGEWTANTAYEALTIVTRNGNSYTSKKTVPATIGAPESNPDYWASTGIYNAQVQELREDIDSNTSRISAIEGQYEQKRRFILIGDSYGQGWNGEADVIGWCEAFKNRHGLSNTDCYYYAQGGAGFTHTPTFLSELQNLTVADPETITDILVSGGYNDHSATAADLGTAINAFYTYAHTTYPNARIWIGFSGVSRAADGAIRVELDVVRTNYYNESRMLHLPDTSIFTQMYSPCYGTDDFHLSQQGYTYMADFYWAGIHGGTLKTNRTVGNLSTTFTENYSSSGQLRFWMNDDMLTISIPSSYRLNVGSEKPVGGSPVKIADLPVPFLGKNGIAYNALPVTGALHFASTGFVDMHGSLSIYNNGLYLKIGNVSGGQYIDLTNLDYILFDNATFYIPAHEIM